MKITVPSRLGAVICAGLLAPACSQPSSRPQSALAPAASASALSTRALGAAAVFPLIQGSFVIENASGDGIAGTYTGTFTLGAGGSQDSSLALQVTAGSGAFAGATGSLLLTGQGAFADEGTFVMGGSGEVARQDGKSAVLILRLRGSSTAGCTASNQIAITQIADGTLGRIGRVTARLNHAVLNTGCTS